MKLEQLIKALNLQPHPIEGGYFCETYRSAQDSDSDRCYSTAIYYLLTPKTFSEIHRLKSDEVFHFYLGDPVEMIHLHEDGAVEEYILGSDILNGQICQLVVPRMVWQGCRLRPGGKFALLGCTVAPGFEFKDYESGSRDDLVTRYPEHQTIITQLTRKNI